MQRLPRLEMRMLGIPAEETRASQDQRSLGKDIQKERSLCRKGCL
jgi:hypothetical protein